MTIGFKKIFDLSWKSLLVVAVFFITFTSTNILIASWKDILSSEQIKNYIAGGKYLTIGDSKLKILLADDPEEREMGLSGREELRKDHGMLFIFPEVDKHGIWMKDMKFSIDVIWFNDTFLVVDYVEGITPDTYPTVFRPKKDAKYVLEVHEGFIKDNGIKIDDQATFLD